jgi:type II secretory pathway pseudopilin PulG
MKKKFSIERGQSLIEIILVMALSAIILPALLTGLINSREGKVQQAQRTQAIYLLNETVDAVRSVREKGWAQFAVVDGTYHTAISSSSWVLLPNLIAVNGFTQSITITGVSRDTNGAIVSSGGTLDPSSKNVNITISWGQPYPSAVNASLLMTRYLDNDSSIQTLGLQAIPADFDLGDTSAASTQVTKADDGEVVLGAGGGGGDWCQPSKSIVEVDLPKNGVANAISAIAAETTSTVFAGTGDNSSGVSFAKVPVTGNPPTSASVQATFDGYKTNAVFGEDNYAYLGTDNNSKEVVIIDLNQYTDSPTNSKYKEIGSINVPGAANGDGIYVLSNKAYILAGNKLYIYDITTRSGAHSTALNGGLVLSGAGKKVLVASSGSNTYAYIATSSNSNQFQIINVTNAASPSIVGQKTLGTAQSGVDVYVNTQNPGADRAYFVTSYSAGKQNFFILNIGDKANPSTIGSGYNTNGMSPKGLTVVTGNRAIIVGTGGTDQYQVVNISNEASPVSCAALQYGTGVHGVASVLQSSSGFAYSYIITGDSNAELKIILGGAGALGGSYTSAGTFTSSVFEKDHDVFFNRFEPDFKQPSQTTIEFQVAVAEAVSGSCAGATYSFVGPDGTSSTRFTAGGAIPLSGSGSYRNPGRCFKYKVFFTTNDSTQTSELDSFTINYSP